MMDIAITSVTLRNDVNLPEPDDDDIVNHRAASHWDDYEDDYADEYDFYF